MLHLCNLLEQKSKNKMNLKINFLSLFGFTFIEDESEMNNYELSL